MEPNPSLVLPPLTDSTLESLLGLAVPNFNAATFFGFRVGRLALLVPASFHCEVIEQTQANPLPNTQRWFSGLINLRGNLIPVIDLRLALGEADTGPVKRRLFVIGKGERAVALWIDGLPAVLGIESDPLAQLPDLPDRLQGFVAEGYTLEGQVWLSLHYDAFFKALGSQIAA